MKAQVFYGPGDLRFEERPVPEPGPGEIVIRIEAARAHAYYERAREALPRADQRSLFAAEIMGQTYFALLDTIERRRFRVFGARVSVPTPRKLGIALSCWVQSRWGQPMRGRTRA